MIGSAFCGSGWWSWPLQMPPHIAESYQSVNDARQPHSERGPNSGTFVYIARSGEYRRQLVTARAACDVRMQRLTVGKVECVERNRRHWTRPVSAENSIHYSQLYLSSVHKPT